MSFSSSSMPRAMSVPQQLSSFDGQGRLPRRNVSEANLAARRGDREEEEQLLVALAMSAMDISPSSSAASSVDYESDSSTHDRDDGRDDYLCTRKGQDELFVEETPSFDAIFA